MSGRPPAETPRAETPRAETPRAETPRAEPPRGLALFAPGTPPAVRRRRLIFVLLCLPALASLMWPAFSWLAGPFPLVLGLPLPFAWVVAVVLWVFLALWWLDRGDRGDRGEREARGDRGVGG